MKLLAIDPGTKHSAWVVYDTDSDVPDSIGFDSNDVLTDNFRDIACSGITPVIEMIACYGMPVGRETFETCVWIGRFHEAMGHAEYVFRKDIKLHLCHSARAKDANIRQSLLDRFPSTGGGSTPQVGTKKQPGPLFGVSKHVWSALAVAVFYSDTNKIKE